MSKMNCDTCGEPINDFSAHYYSLNNNRTYFCSKCWEQFFYLRFDDSKKEAAKAFFQEKIDQGSMTAQGEECVRCFWEKEQTQEFPENAGNTPSAPQSKLSAAPSRSNNSALILFILGIIWIIIAIFLFFISDVKLDKESAKYLGVDSVANFQGTIFTIGALIVGTLNIIGGVIVKEIGKLKE